MVTTAGALSAVCADGTDVVIDPGPNWSGVSIGPDTILAEGTVRRSARVQVTFALADGTAVEVGEAALGVISRQGRLAFVQQDGITVEAEAMGSEPAFSGSDGGAAR